MCKTPPPGRGGRAGGPARGGAGGRGPQAPGPREYSVTEIPGVIAAGQKWNFVWQQAGNNGDGIVGVNDGSLLLAQNDRRRWLDKNSKTVATRTRTGGALSMSPKGNLASSSAASTRASTAGAPGDSRRLSGASPSASAASSAT